MLSISNKGYYRQTVYNHPLKKQGSYMSIHRLIMEKYLTELNGIPTYIHPNLIVHHIDFDKTNNNISNLQILTKSDHDRIHADKRFKDMSDRICSDCGSNTTYIRKDNGWILWYDNPKGGWWCKKCYMKRNNKNRQ
jgi:hypothetical protein